MVRQNITDPYAFVGKKQRTEDMEKQNGPAVSMFTNPGSYHKL